jgi:hypothetical protein
LLLGPAAGQPPPPPRGGPPGQFGPFGPPGRGLRQDSDGLLDDLSVSGNQKARAREALRAYDEKMRQAAIQSRRELLDKMKDVLSADDFSAFKDELGRVPLISTTPLGPRGARGDDLTDRLMAFDRNKDGKVTKDELPERMHALIDQGDRNKDGALDPEEIRQLASRQAQAPPPPGRGGPGPGGRPPRPLGPPGPPDR